MHMLHLQIGLIEIVILADTFDASTTSRLVVLQVVFYLFSGIQWFHQGAV